MMLDADRQLGQGILILRPVGVVRGHLLQLGQNRRQARGAQIAEVGGVLQVFDRPIHPGAVSKQLERVVDLAGGRIAPQTPVGCRYFIETQRVGSRQILRQHGAGIVGVGRAEQTLVIGQPIGAAQVLEDTQLEHAQRFALQVWWMALVMSSMLLRKPNHSLSSSLSRQAKSFQKLL